MSNYLKKEFIRKFFRLIFIALTYPFSYVSFQYGNFARENLGQYPSDPCSESHYSNRSGVGTRDGDFRARRILLYIWNRTVEAWRRHRKRDEKILPWKFVWGGYRMQLQNIKYKRQDIEIFWAHKYERIKWYIKEV